MASAFRRKKPAATVLLALSFAALASAHDIPRDVTVQAFVKPEGQQFRVLVRVPLNAMRDVQFPVRGPGFLDPRRRTRSWGTRRCSGSPAASSCSKGT